MPPAACWCTRRWPTSSSTTWSREVATLVVGEPGAGDDVEIGPLVSKAHFDRVSGFLERAAAAGITAAVGGAPLDGPGYFVPPTVLVDVPGDAEVRPRGDLRPGRHRGDLRATRTRPSAAPTRCPTAWPPRCSPRTPAAASTSPRKLDFGTVWVNSHLVLATEAPWGGFKGSGYGRDLSLYALDDYSRTKHVMHNHGR